MTRPTGHFRAYMRSVIELHVRRWTVVINAHPRNLLAAHLKSGDLLDLRPVSGNDHVTAHAELDAWNDGLWTDCRSTVAVIALQPVCQMNFMGIGNGLCGIAAQPQKI